MAESVWSNDKNKRYSVGPDETIIFKPQNISMSKNIFARFCCERLDLASFIWDKQTKSNFLNKSVPRGIFRRKD